MPVVIKQVLSTICSCKSHHKLQHINYKWPAYDPIEYKETYAGKPDGATAVLYRWKGVECGIQPELSKKYEVIQRMTYVRWVLSMNSDHIHRIPQYLYSPLEQADMVAVSVLWRTRLLMELSFQAVSLVEIRWPKMHHFHRVIDHTNGACLACFCGDIMTAASGWNH